MLRGIPSLLILALLCVVFFPAAAAEGQTTWYVDDDAPNDPEPGDPYHSDPLEDGSAEHPFDAIQEGIDAASDGDTVLVLDGTYTGDGNRDIEFGGRLITIGSQNGADNCIIDCQGSEEDPHRGFDFNESGETPDAVVDGFTITNGFADGDGGGVRCEHSSPTIRNCTITLNTASSNTTYCCGGGLSCSGSPTIANCVITANAAEDAGGGIYNWDSGHVTISDCTISGNTASGIHSCSRTVTIVRCTIANNTGGEGIFIGHGDTATICSCVIAGHAVGGILFDQSDPGIISNSLIMGNGGGFSGGIYCVSTDSLTLSNCSIVANSTDGSVPGVRSSESDLSIANCVIWGNSTESGCQIRFTSGSSAKTLAVAHSDIEGGASDIYCSGNVVFDWGAGNIVADPLFADGDYRLDPNSPCIDAGDTDALPADAVDLDGDGDTDEAIPYDLDGQTRVLHCRVDMGAYESVGYPDCNGNGEPDGCDIADGTSQDVNTNGIPDDCDPDCNGNGVPDEIDLADETSTDMDGNGVPDECDPDCNKNGIPDDHEIGTFLDVWTPRLSPIGGGSPQSLTLQGPPAALGNVTLQIEAYADLDNSNEWLSVGLNESIIATLFESDGHTCPDGPDTAELVISQDDYNSAVDGGDAVFVVAAADGVNPDICDPPSYVIVRVQYEHETNDSNGNEVLDECEIVEDTAQDVNDDSVPLDSEEGRSGNGESDDSDTGDDGTSTDADGDDIPDESDTSDQDTVGLDDNHGTLSGALLGCGGLPALAVVALGLIGSRYFDGRRRPGRATK